MPKSRREFLLFRSSPEARIELSCQKLYMRYVDATLPDAGGDEYVPGEPLREVAQTKPDELFRKLDEDLRGVDVLQLVDTGWLASGDSDFRRHVETVLEGFRARGGHVI